MKTCIKASKIIYGGDYNPEQWPEEIWEEDMRLLKKAHIDTVTLNVFSWALLQPSEETYYFEKLDRIMEMAKQNGLNVILATSTAAHPAWMAKRYPDILRVDGRGMKRKFGARHNSCPNSPTYRKYSVRLAEKLAERYGHYDNIVAWHISNEYYGECYCDNCEKAFRVWLREKYGSLKEVNRAWNTSFWGHTFYDWDEIVVPDYRSELFAEERTEFQGMTLDYRCFNSDSLLQCFRLEYDAVKKITPHIPVTTNFMGCYKTLDYKKWGAAMDFVSWDNYPSNDDTPAEIAFNHELMRGVGGGGPFILMEQTPGVSNWLPNNPLKRPGVMRLWSYQAVAHGSDSVLFFQMRRSIGACEKMHSAVIDHVGTGNTRVFREVAALGEELEKIGDKLLGAEINARTALYFDWNNWWAVESSAGPSFDLKYREEVLNYYQALFAQNIPVDIIGPGDDLGKYRIVIAPVLYLLPQGADEAIRKFVKNGGIFLTTFLSGIVDENDLVVTGGYPGKLRDILGIWVEEIDALPAGKKNYFQYKGVRHKAELLCDVLHLEGAKALAAYEEDFYAGFPAVTCNTFGKGRAYYIATRSDAEFYAEFLREICSFAGINPFAAPVENVEVTIRSNENGNFMFLLNHSSKSTGITLEYEGTSMINGVSYQHGEGLTLPGYGVEILQIVRN